MRKNIYLNIFLFLTVIFFLSSCVDQKQLAYFHKDEGQSDTILAAKAYVPKIQSGDILNISIGSLNPLASSFFNPFSNMPVTGDNGSASSSGSASSGVSGSTTQLVQSSAPGYLVDASGTIDLPLIGTIKITDLTTKEAKDLIKEKLKFYLKEPAVSVRFLNYKISVLGEVLHPSVYVIPNESITLPEAISIAGDITLFGKRNNILVIRNNNGKKEFGRVNLNNREVFNSPYYYLHANDIVYVEPSKGRAAQLDRTYQFLPAILSGLSLLIILVEYKHK
jgi:polysaccharide biosynthesis/export protein